MRRENVDAFGRVSVLFVGVDDASEAVRQPHDTSRSSVPVGAVLRAKGDDAVAASE